MAQDVIKHANVRAATPSMRRLVSRTGTNGRAPRSRSTAVRKSRARSPSSSSDDDEPAPPRAASRASVIWTPIAIDLLFVGARPEELRRVECGYCRNRTRGVRGGIERWWNAHPCDVDEARARHNRELILAQGGAVLEAAAA
jgi:hypothetical protein